MAFSPVFLLPILLFSILILPIAHSTELTEDYEYEMKVNRRKATLAPRGNSAGNNAPIGPVQMATTPELPVATTQAAPSILSYSTMLPDPAQMNPYLNRAEKSALFHRAYYRRLKTASIEERIIIQAEFREKLRQIMQDKMSNRIAK